MTVFNFALTWKQYAIATLVHKVTDTKETELVGDEEYIRDIELCNKDFIKWCTTDEHFEKLYRGLNRAGKFPASNDAPPAVWKGYNNYIDEFVRNKDNLDPKVGGGGGKYKSIKGGKVNKNGKSKSKKGGSKVSAKAKSTSSSKSKAVKGGSKATQQKKATKKTTKK